MSENKSENIPATEQIRHQFLVPTNHDEKARQDFVRSYKEYLVKNIHAGNRERYEKTIKPEFEKNKSRSPENRFEVRDLMVNDPYYQMFSSLLRTSQEMMWSSCQIPVESRLNDLNDKIRSTNQKSSIGSLSLQPDFTVPRYHKAVDIHCQPGGYHSEFVKEDASPGMVYDRAVHIYAMGQMGPFNDDMGSSIILWLKENHPDFRPCRILDLGCAVGHSTVPYVEEFDAEVHAVDVAAPMLRYAHARAQDMKAPIHFSQQNAEKLNFPEGYFDLIVSHILLHETSDKAVNNIVRECHRLLSEGGVMIHAETPPYEGMSPFDAFMLDWDTRNNNEPFWSRSHEIDLDELSTKSGFNVDKKFETMIPSAFQIEKVRRSKVFQGGDFGGGGQWFVYGNWK